MCSRWVHRVRTAVFAVVVGEVGRSLHKPFISRGLGGFQHLTYCLGVVEDRRSLVEEADHSHTVVVEEVQHYTAVGEADHHSRIVVRVVRIVEEEDSRYCTVVVVEGPDCGSLGLGSTT